jgi:hypothetical protein
MGNAFAFEKLTKSSSCGQLGGKPVQFDGGELKGLCARFEADKPLLAAHGRRLHNNLCADVDEGHDDEPRVCAVLSVLDEDMYELAVLANRSKLTQPTLEGSPYFGTASGPLRTNDSYGDRLAPTRPPIEHSMRLFYVR